MAGGGNRKAKGTGTGTSKFANAVNQMAVKDELESGRSKRPRRSGRSDAALQGAAQSLLAPPSDHEMYMKRASYQDIFKDVTGASDPAEGKGIQPSPLSTSGQTGTHMLAAAAASQAAMMHMGNPQGSQSRNGRKSNPPPLVMPPQGQKFAPNGKANVAPNPMTQQLQMQMQVLLQATAHQQQQQQQAAAVAAAMSPNAYTPTSVGSYEFNAPGSASPMAPPGTTPMTPGSAASIVSNGGGGNDVKKASRLWKNRIAAKECRRKKKEYVKDLETRCKELEAENEQLQHQLAAARSSLTAEQKEAVKAQMKHHGDSTKSTSNDKPKKA